MLEYIFSITDHFTAAVFFTMLKYAALGFVLSLVLVIVCLKFKLFQRQNKYWNIFAKLHYFFIPIVFIGAGLAFGFLQYYKNINDDLINTILQPVKQTAVNHLQSLPPETRDHFSSTTPKKAIQNAIQFVTDPESENTKGVINRIPSFIREWLLSAAVTEMIIYELNKEIASFTGIEKESINKLWQQNVIDIFKSDFLNNLLSQRINEQIISLQKTLGYILLLLMLIPVTDILIAKRLKKRSSVEKKEK
ncbi:MAG: hypothetical protein FWH56_12000 [Betaproteobacteria bacterium]|nr:hypothetical protein [Betaproteobacteria bacterium]